MENTNNRQENGGSDRQTRRKISDELRELVINHARNNLGNAEISRVVGLPRTTVCTIVSSYLKEGKTRSGERGGDKRTILSAEQKDRIRQLVDADATVTLNALQRKVCEEMAISVSTSTINRCLDEFHYTVKTLNVVPVRRNCESTIATRVTYGTEFQNVLFDVGESRIVFIDEVGYNVSQRVRFGRSQRGTPARISVPQVRSRNISVIAAMTANGMVYHSIVDGAVNGEIFKGFLTQLKTVCESKGIMDCYFVMDNARIHHYRGLTETIQALSLRILYLPPYSPFLNTIENVFSKWKNAVKRGAAVNDAQLRFLISSSFDLITPEDCEGYFRKMKGYILRSINGEVISE